MDQKKTSPDKTKYNKNTHEWEEEDLDEEMDAIFHPTNDHFNLADLSEGSTGAKPRFDENDYDSHRRESFQYHQPLHKLYHKHRKSSRKSEPEDSPASMSTVNEEPVLDPSNGKEKPQEDEPLLSKNVPAGSSSNPKDDSKVQFYVGSSSSLENISSKERKPLRSVLRNYKGEASTEELSPSVNREKKSSEDALSSGEAETSFGKLIQESSGPPAVGSSKEKSKVKFLLGEESQSDFQRDLQKGVSGPAKSSFSRHTRRRSVKRKHHGFNMDVKKYNTVLEPEEAETLQTADIDDMASHRFEDPKGIRRSKINDKFWPTYSKEDDIRGSDKIHDHEPHELFIELHELKSRESSSDMEWRQTARWIKYEEDADPIPDRWGKPHISPLCFHSLIKLRQIIESGAVLLDLEERDMISITNKVADAMIQTDQINTKQKEIICQTLSWRHRHVNEKIIPPMRRNSSGYGNLNMLSHDKNRSPLFSLSTRNKSLADTHHTSNNVESSASPETAVLVDSQEKNIEIVTPDTRRKSIAAEKEKAQDPGILRRVPENAEGVAILVGELSEIKNPAFVFIRLAEAKDIPNILEIPINLRFLFVLFGPKDFNINFHEVGRALGALMSNEDFRDQAYSATSPKDILSGINVFLDSSTVVPPGKWEKALLPVDEIRRKSLSAAQERKVKEKPPEKPLYQPLKRTGRIFGGFIQDIKHRYPFYWSDIKDGFDLQCIASVIFIYFAAVSGAIAFGGLLADKTELNIGVSETLIGTAVCGIIFSLFAGQPLIIIGTTGPLLLFDEMLYQLKGYYTSDFLVIRVWVGIWTAIISFVVVAAEGSILVKFFSRFVQEIFATIISLLFIYESLYKLYTIFVEHPLVADYCDSSVFNATNSTTTMRPQPNTALLSTILMFGTFYIAFFLRHFRNSKFLGRSARRALGDFGVPIGIVIMVAIDNLIKDTYTQKLSVPEGLSPSIQRSWFISPLPITVGEAFIALIGGLLIFILLFMETQICELIISKKSLQKGSGFHIDMLVVGIIGMISAFIGSPWQCAATVRSISHVSSLIVWSRTHAPGELPHIVEVKEQRLTNFLVSTLIGMSVMMAPLLRLIPLSVLFGVFLYMGISALSGLHLFERFILIFMPTKHHPDFEFVRKVRTNKMHLYTVIQILCICVLWIIKTFLAPAFPFGLLSMVFVHSQIKRLFTNEEIKALDEEDFEDDKNNEDDPDFYEQLVA